MGEGMNDFILNQFSFLPNLSVTTMDNNQDAISKMKSDGLDIFNGS